MLTALEQPSSAHPIVSWWNLADNTSGAEATPGHYAGAAPDGWVYTVGKSIYDESTSGTAHLITKVAGIGHTIHEAKTGPNGVVVYGNTAAYVTFAGTVTPLDIDHYSAAHHDRATCDATSSTVTACQFVDVSGKAPKILATERVPLDGGACRSASQRSRGMAPPWTGSHCRPAATPGP